MPEAVIVVNRPLADRPRLKGSLKDIRPDDLAARWCGPRWTRFPSSTRTTSTT